MAKKISADSTIKFFISVIGLFVIGIILVELNHIFLSLVVAYFLFFLFSPLNNLLEKDKVPMFFIVLIDLIILIIITWGVSQFLIDSFIRLGKDAPAYAERLNTIVRNAAVSIGTESKFFTEFSIQEIIAKIDYKILAGGVFTSTFNVMGNLLFLLFFFIFVITGHKNIYEAFRKRFINRRVKPEIKKFRRHSQKIYPETESLQDENIEGQFEHEKSEKELQLSETFNKITKQIQRYIIAKIGVNLMAGIVVGIIAYLFGLDFPVILGLFTFLFNFIPTIGSAIALILPVLLSLIQFDSIGSTIAVALLIGIIQTLFFNIIEPLVIGKKLNLNPLLILIAVLIWGYIWGIIGMLLAVPLTAIIKIIISNSKSKNLMFLNDLMSED